MKTCEICKNPVAKSGNRFCSVECRNKNNAHQQKKTGEYRTCVICGKRFYVYPSDVKRRKAIYCSNACKSKGMETKPKNSKIAEDSRRTSKSKTIKLCQHCGDEFETYKKTQRYCSHKCASESSKVARVKLPCDYCGETMLITYSRFNASESHFCSHECYSNSKIKDLSDREGLMEYECVNCGKKFYARIYDVSKNGGRFCSMSCFSSWRSRHAELSYSNRKGGKRDDLDGLYVRSSWEANYARYLNWLKDNGDILGWEYEPETFEFEGIKKGTRFYTPDFKVTDSNGDIAYHEVKGYMDASSKTKLKRMAKYYPNINLILIDEPVYKSIAKTMRSIIPNWETKK